ncbi:hypothetical protein GCM10023340_27840 [Nocardioides marinquilinus]|uniref:Uncharacterized protein n=1 Tax=Nocardioides marinquilinus TaxID=1210400 RepID=A0ABP9PQG3_9ACTN
MNARPARRPAALSALGVALAATSALSGTAHAAPAPTAGPAEAAPSVQAAAVPGSLLFVRDHDVWIARADGTGARAVTADGTASSAYRTPTQADDGTIVAARGSVIVRMTPAGRVLNRLDPPAIEDSTGYPLKTNLTDTAVSPDGRHVAYTYAHHSCAPGAGCYYRSVTGFTRADRLTDPAQYGESYYDAPAWISDTRTVQGGGGGVTVNLQDLGSDPVRWFSDVETGGGGDDLYDPAVSTAAGLYAAVRGYGAGTHIAWYDLTADPTRGTPSAPAIKCATSDDPSLGSPTFSADGGVLAWQEGRDVWATSDPSRCDHQPRVWLTNASDPAFSAARYTVPAPELVARPTVSGTPKAGATMRARPGSWAAATSYAYRWLRDGRPVVGATRATYRLTKADAGRRVSVVVTARGVGGTARATSNPVRVRR